MTEPTSEAPERVPGLGAAWKAAIEESQGLEASPPEDGAEGEAPATEPNPAADATEPEQGRTDDVARDSGDAEPEEPNPEESAEAADDFDPVLKTFDQVTQEGLRALPKEQRASIAKRIRNYEKAHQEATQRAAKAAKAEEALNRLIGNDKGKRDRFWKWTAEDDKAGVAGAEPATNDEPDPADFEDMTAYRSARRDWLKRHDDEIVERAVSTLTAPQRAVASAEEGLREWRSVQGDAVTDHEFDAACKALGRTLARNPERVQSLTPERAIESVEAMIEAMRAAAPARAPVKVPNPATRRVQAASVPTTRGTPQKAVATPIWEREGRDPTLAEAWAASEEEATQGTRPTSRNGAMR